jgi:hypothetical protein
MRRIKRGGGDDDGPVRSPPGQLAVWPANLRQRRMRSGRAGGYYDDRDARISITSDKCRYRIQPEVRSQTNSGPDPQIGTEKSQ